MRDIRFRVWEPRRKRFMKLYEAVENLMNIFNGKLISNIDDIFQDDAVVEYYKDDSYVMMQYTGLDDKNGKPIFEGDICKFYYDYEDYNIESIGEIQYIGDGFKIDYNSVDLEAYFEIADVLWKDKMNKYRVFEIIGNIYENPELLDKQT